MPTEEKETPGRRLLAGSLAGTTSVMVTYPLDLLRARLAYQVKTHEFMGIRPLLKQMSNEHKYLSHSYYRGFMPTCKRCLIATSILSHEPIYHTMCFLFQYMASCRMLVFHFLPMKHSSEDYDRCA